MTKREQYGLTFYKALDSTGKIVNGCNQSKIDSYSRLTIIGRMDIAEVKSLAEELSDALNAGSYEQYFSSDSVEADDIELIYPHITINDLTLPMQDVLDLLNEWIEFAN